MNENDNFALVPKTPAAIEKVVPGAKRLLAGMVADTLALVKKETAVLKRIKPPRIVVVDDDSLFKMYELRIRDWFKTVTFLSFANSDHAWHELSQTDPDFLIVQMPSPGVELLSLLAEKKVKYPILVTSGFFDEKEVRQRVDPNLNVSFLEKPFTVEQFNQELLIHFGPGTVPQTAQRLTREFELKWRFGARTAALIVKLANRFASRIQISRGEEVADAKSFMDLCSVSADMSKIAGPEMPDFRTDDIAEIGCGDRVRVSVEGPDAAAAMEALTELFTCGSRVERCIEPSCSSRPALGRYTKDYISYGCKKGHDWDVPRSDKS